MNKKCITNTVTFAGLLLFSANSWAGCSVSGGAYNYSATLTAQNLSVPRDKLPGSAIGNVMPIGAGVAKTIACSDGASWTHLKFGTALTPSDIPGIYKTNVEGIGIKVWDDFSGTVVVENDIKRWYLITNNATYNGGAWLTNIKAQYYVIGPVGSGTVSPAFTVEAWANTATTTSGGALYNMLTVSGSTVVTSAACETPDISVNLNKHDSDAFPQVGSTSPATPFNFKMNNCGAGLTSVSYTFKPAPGITLEGSGAGQYLTLDSSSTASGVGVQVLYENGTPVPFNTKTQFTGYTGAGSYTIAMKARYIRTGKITGGTANSVVEFDMTYE